MGVDWQLIKQLLAEASTRPTPAERAAYLDGVCGCDVALRAEVEKLLAAHDQAGAFLEEPALPAPELAAALPTPPTEQAGDKIGPYKLLQQVGEGGCGVVYMAEQEEPIRRRVALKIIKLGMDTRAVIARFEAERQALALMDHPNIARVLDAGTTDTGRPYFVMELVRGIKITDYCDQHHLSTSERLNLFIQVCHAIQHAHQKGIIHRDVKPSNILVTLNDGVPVPKVIDFGIAKATGQRLTDKTLFTAFEQFIGTPAYMSPEQAAMTSLDIDTRSDIYSLGVLLCELLTGHTPFDARDLLTAGLDEMRRIIREQEPKRPSTRLSTLAAADQTTIARCRQSEPPQLIHLVRGDLDWIVMRCLEKDRTRRYETANSLAEDIERHLSNQPVTARPPSRVYLFRKLVQRNKAMFAAGGLVVWALVAGLGFSLWTLRRERAAQQQTLDAQRQAQSEASKSRQVAQFLKDMLQGVGPSAAQGRDTTMLREVLNRTAERVGKDLKDQPEVEAELSTTLGDVYEALGLFDQAEVMYRQALALRQALWGLMNTNVADSLDILGQELRNRRGEAVESQALLNQALLIRTQLLGLENVQVATSLNHLGGVQLYLGNLAEADDLFRRSLAIRRRLLGDEHPDVAESFIMLADTVRYQGKLQEAEGYAREALAIETHLLQGRAISLRVALAQESLGGALLEQGNGQEAVGLLRNAAATRKELLGSEHLDTAGAIFNLGRALRSANQLEEAERMLREALAICRNHIGDRYTLTAFCYETLGDLLAQTDRVDEAEAAYRGALEQWKMRENGQVRRVRTQIVLLLRSQQRTAEAEAFVAQAAAEAREMTLALGRQPPSAAGVKALLRLAEAVWCQGRAAEAEAVLVEVLSISSKLEHAPPLADEISNQAVRTAAMDAWFGRAAEHACLSEQMLEWAANQPGSLSKLRAVMVANLRLNADEGFHGRTLALARAALAAAPTNSMFPIYQLAMGVAQHRHRNSPEATKLLAASESGGYPGPFADSWRRIAEYFRVMILFEQGQTEAALQLFTESESRMKPLPAVLHWALMEGADYPDMMAWLAYKEAQAMLNASPN